MLSEWSEIEMKLLIGFLLLGIVLFLGSLLARPMRRDHILEHQQIFTTNVARLITYINQQGYKCTFGEVYRPTEMAQIYAKLGKGIINSNHCSKLAVDLNLFDSEGKYLTDGKD